MPCRSTRSCRTRAKPRRNKSLAATNWLVKTANLATHCQLRSVAHPADDDRQLASRWRAAADRICFNAISRHRRCDARDAEVGLHPGRDGAFFILDGGTPRCAVACQLRGATRVLQ